MTGFLRWSVGFLVVLALTGCGAGKDPNLVRVTGKITLDGKPLSNALITFVPIADTPGQGSFGQTGANGTYDLTTPQGQEGILVGEYKVYISKRVMPDGSDVPPDDMTPPIESEAREILPPQYSMPEETKLTATVAPGGGTINFPLQGKRDR